MKHFRWQILLASVLIFLSAIFYFFHYAIFHDTHHIFIYLVGDIAFVPIEVLLVTVIIHRVLITREKRPHGKAKHGHRGLLQRSWNSVAHVLF